MSSTRSAPSPVTTEPQARANGSPLEILLIFLKLGCTCFGGPIAHLGYFRAEFVQRRQWLTEQAYTDLVALAQFLPGPASSQTGFAIGLMRGGLLGGLAAWAGFTLPSAALLVLFAYGAGSIASSHAGAGLLHGLKLVAVAIVAQAVMGMARTLCPDRIRASIATIALVVMLIAPWSILQLGTILAGGIAGWLLCRGEPGPQADRLVMPVSPRFGVVCLVAFFLLLAVSFMPVRAGAVALFDAFYRSGALVFGGGHVVLPLLRNAVVVPGWVSDNSFLAGYGAAQAVPGPLFTFAAYLGAVAGVAPGDSSARSSPLSRFSFPASSVFSGSCRSGMLCLCIRRRKRPCTGPTLPWWACSARRFTTLSGPVLYRNPLISRLP